MEGLRVDAGLAVTHTADDLFKVMRWHQVGVVEVWLMRRRFLFDDTAFDIALRIWTRVPLDHLTALNHDLLVLGQDDQHAAGFAAILSTEDENFVVLFDWRNSSHLYHLRSKRNDLHKSFVAQLPRDRSENASPDGFVIVIDQH